VLCSGWWWQRLARAWLRVQEYYQFYVATEIRRATPRCVFEAHLGLEQMLPHFMLGLTKSQQSVKTSFGKVVCELKATKLDFPSKVPKTGLRRQGIQAVSIKLKSLVIKMPTRVVLT
jgi:hypothetical protein